MNMNEKKPNVDIVILVNGQERTVNKGDISYEELVQIAFDEYVESPEVAYTILFFKGQSGKPKGELVKGETVKVHKGMVFNVTRTDRS